MFSRTSQLASALVLSACFAGAAFAQTAAPAAAQPAKTPTPQQQHGRLQQVGRGQEGRRSQDLHERLPEGRAAGAAKQLTPQQQKMKDCNAKAGEQKLTGDKRKTFMSTCLKG